MKTVTTAVIVLALCGAVILGTVVLEKGGQWQQARSQIAIRELDAEIAKSDASRAEAEAAPFVVRENWDGLIEYTETTANVSRDRATTDALIALALADYHAQQEWRRYVQAMFALVLFSLIVGGALVLVHDATREPSKRRAGGASGG